FSITVTGTNVQPSATFLGAESPGTTVTLDPGSYSVDEGAVTGYSKSLSTDCTGTIGPGVTKTCTITNDDQPTSLTVFKHVINNNGGTKSAGDFSLHVKSGGTDVTGSPQAGSESGTVYSLNAGTYVVSEDAVAGYLNVSMDLTNGDCDMGGSVTLALGESKT